MEHEHYRIGQLADELGINPKTIRYYEELGLLAPAARNAAGYRQYTSREREALRFVSKAKASGLTLAEIGEILALRRAVQEPCAHGRLMLDGKPAVVEEQLRALSAFRDALPALRDAAAAASPGDGRAHVHCAPPPERRGCDLVRSGRTRRCGACGMQLRRSPAHGASSV